MDQMPRVLEGAVCADGLQATSLEVDIGFERGGIPTSSDRWPSVLGIYRVGIGLKTFLRFRVCGLVGLTLRLLGFSIGLTFGFGV